MHISCIHCINPVIFAIILFKSFKTLFLRLSDAHLHDKLSSLYMEGKHSFLFICIFFLPYLFHFFKGKFGGFRTCKHIYIFKWGQNSWRAALPTEQYSTRFKCCSSVSFYCSARTPGIQWQTVRDTWGRSQKNDYLISTCHRGLSLGCTRCTKTSYAFLNASLTRVMQIKGAQVTTSAKNKNSKASRLCVARCECRLSSSQTL